MFESDPKHPAKTKKSFRLPTTPKPVKIKEKSEGLDEGSIFLSTTGLGAAAAQEDGLEVPERERVSQTLLVGGGGGAGGGMCGGGRGSDDGWGSQDPGSWNGRESTDAYYEMMIQANPGNSLLLANYAKFLKEVLSLFNYY